MAEFLFEIGLEEVPARMIPGAEAELLRRTVALLERERLLASGFDPLVDAKSYSTPRRLAVGVKDVLATQPDVTEEVTGPAVKIAFKDGVATPAAEAFARKNGVGVAELKTIQTPKGEYLAATTVKQGRSAAEVIASELPKELAAIYWAKNMYWRPGKPERFVRPVLWMACLLGEDVVPVEFGGRTAGRATYGHRVLSTGEPFEIVSPASYAAQLEGEFVLVDVEARRHRIRKALDRVTRTVEGARWREDEPLVDQVTHLTEWPTVLLGGFESAYLELPEEVLVTVMRDHQKYFAVEDATGKLAPHFLAVLNIELDAVNEPIIRQGNERVLRARFNDARFFWEFDQRTSLFEREELLKRITFEQQLGSYWDKSQAVQKTVTNLCSELVHRSIPLDSLSVNRIEMAARLCKTDLTTELVKEFTELQGIIGGYYAKRAGFDTETADAIYWQYEPLTFESKMPPLRAYQILSLADKLNTIVDMFAIRKIPTGSKDPFALRRQASAVVKILAEGAVGLTVTDVVRSAVLASRVATSQTQNEVTAFIGERFEYYLRTLRGFSADVVSAVLLAAWDDYPDAIARAEAISAARGGEDFAAVAAAFKRMKNILAQAKFAAAGGSAFASAGVPAEDALWAKFTTVDAAVQASAAKHEYRAALEAIATLRPEVDAFFDAVMVNDPDATVRERRLTLLSTLVERFAGIADFSEIVTAGGA